MSIILGTTRTGACKNFHRCTRHRVFFFLFADGNRQQCDRGRGGEEGGGRSKVWGLGREGEGKGMFVAGHRGHSQASSSSQVFG